MLEFSKLILQRVSFDRLLFEKELKKAIKWIRKDEILVLKAWCVATFGHQYQDVIAGVFESTL